MTHPDLVIIGGGQSGLATAYVALARGLRPIVLDASAGPGGSWPRYYDSLTLFSPARFSALPGAPFPGDPEHHPTRDEVVDYLDRYAAMLDIDLRRGERVEAVNRLGGDADGAPADGFEVRTASGLTLRAPAVVAASGGFDRPHRPDLPGLASFTGTLRHSAEYRGPEPYAGSRIVVVGAGNSAVQIAAELATVARVSIATRGPLRWQPQRILGRDLHWWLVRSGLDASSLGPRLFGDGVPVIDDGRYRAALRTGNPDHRPLFRRIDGDRVRWLDGGAERVDVLILATGFRPDLRYLDIPDALDLAGTPRHRGGISRTVPGLGFVGLERQRSFASATLRGVGRDAAHVLTALTRVTTGASHTRASPEAQRWRSRHRRP